MLDFSSKATGKSNLAKLFCKVRAYRHMKIKKALSPFKHKRFLVENKCKTPYRYKKALNQFQHERYF